MLKKTTYKFDFQTFSDYLRYFVVFFVILFFSNHTKAQTADTVIVGEIKTYRVQNQQQNSWLHWDVWGGEILTENPTQTDSVAVKWTNSGIGELSVYEQTELNCKGQTTEIEILVLENDFDIVLDIPNAFTPNEDNTNDYFTIGCNYPPQNYKITIVSRWGNTVFESYDIENSWDGRTSGEYCSPGVYYYVIQYQNNGKTETKNGFLHLFR
jgi:gliding motility-associated-like protein